MLSLILDLKRKNEIWINVKDFCATDIKFLENSLGKKEQVLRSG